MDKIAIAAVFRHYEEDGAAIPASVEVADPRNPDDVVVHPIIGYLAALCNGRVTYSFMQYQAPEIPYRRPVRPARFSTCRVGHIMCPECNNDCVYPIWGKDGSGMHCPACGHKGLETTPIKETSDEFGAFLGDLRQPLEDALASVDLSNPDEPEFRYPELLLLGHVSPSVNVDPVLQAKAVEKGMGLVPGREATVELLTSEEMGGDDTGLLIAPGVTAGVLDFDRAKNGWSVSEGVVQQSVKLPWLQKAPPKPRRFGGARL